RYERDSGSFTTIDYDVTTWLLAYNKISCEELGILPHVLIVCPIEGWVISFNLSGNIKVRQSSAIIAGSVIFSAANVSMDSNSLINTTALAGAPPSQTSGTPVGYDGAGGGHGGRGASCVRKSGRMSDEDKFGGNGGGRVKLIVTDILYMNGSLLAEGGDGGQNGGGGSGGSIVIKALKLSVEVGQRRLLTKTQQNAAVDKGKRHKSQ
ncbi:hypothetical protein M8C21_026791, partial [Ambrosia artemisiifolia]